MRPLSDWDVLVLADARWDAPKRVRHKMPSAWARAGNRVLWVESGFSPSPKIRPRWDRARILKAQVQTIAPGMDIGLAPACMHRFPESAAQRARDVAYLSCLARWVLRRRRPFDLLVIWQEAAYHRLLDVIPHRRSIYYSSDRYGDNAPSPVQERALETCARRVDLVCATSSKLTALLQPWNETIHVPHAVDVGWYDRDATQWPAEFDRIPEPRAVFTGVATGKFDFELLVETARMRPGIQFVVVGPVEKSARGPAFDAAVGLPNIWLLGPRDAAELPRYIAHADILTLPYKSDVIRTFSGLPLKIYEYFMSGHPVLSTPFTHLELDRPELVRLGGTAASWAEHIDHVLHEGEPSELSRVRREAALANTYEHRVEQQRKALQRL